MRPPIAILGASALLACAPDLREDHPFDGDLPEGDYVTFTDLDSPGARLVPSGSGLPLNPTPVEGGLERVMVNLCPPPLEMVKAFVELSPTWTTPKSSSRGSTSSRPSPTPVPESGTATAPALEASVRVSWNAPAAVGAKVTVMVTD